MLKKMLKFAVIMPRQCWFAKLCSFANNAKNYASTIRQGLRATKCQDVEILLSTIQTGAIEHPCSAIPMLFCRQARTQSGLFLLNIVSNCHHQLNVALAPEVRAVLNVPLNAYENTKYSDFSEVLVGGLLETWSWSSFPYPE